MNHKMNQKTEAGPEKKAAVFHEEDLDALLEQLKSGEVTVETAETGEVTSEPDILPPAEEDSGTGETKKKHSKKNKKKAGSDEKEAFSLKDEIISWIQVLLTAAVIAFVVNTFLIANSQVPTGSMETTIMPGDRVIGSRLSYRFGEPERGDIAIFVYPDDEIIRHVKTYYVKRIIGLPGDTIDIFDLHVYLNCSDTPLDEPYIREPMMLEAPMHYEVPEGCYFMMGDNRNYSNDSRRWTNTYVKREKLVAKVLFQYFPKIQKLD